MTTIHPSEDPMNVAQAVGLSPAERNSMLLADLTFAALAKPAVKREEPIRRLTCTCCGESFKGRQFHNQDIGYGLGDCCLERIRTHRPFGHEPMTEDEIRRTYGIEGIHYNLPAEAPHPTPATREQADQTSNWVPLVKLVGPVEAGNFMLMGNVESLMLYKHCDNRQYLNIDRTTGQTFKYVPGHANLPGSYETIDRDSALAIVGITVLRA